MGHHNIPSPPMEELRHRSTSSRKSNSHSSASKLKTGPRAPKRPSAHIISAAQQPRSHSPANSPTSDSRHKRVWKACERCRMKKTKCDGEFPCKRCKDDGLVCTAGVRKKTEYKQLPRGYAEVLESTQFTLISTIHKLYSMVRNGEQWDLGEPMVNDRGQPIVHNIASKLNCIRPNSDVDLPVHSVFPEDEAGLADLVRQLKEQEDEAAAGTIRATSNTGGGSPHLSDRASSSESDHSELEDFAPTTAATSVASNSPGGIGIGLLSPASLPPYRDVDMDPSATSLFPDQPAHSYGASWGDRSSAGVDFLSGSYSSMDLLSQGLLESEFGSLKPHVVPYQNREVMLGMGDPMMFGGYEDETMRL